MDLTVAESIVSTTPQLQTIGKITYLDEGYSDDEKYVLWEDTEPKYLLRISALDSAPRREAEHKLLRTLADAGIRCSNSYLFGITQTGNACYTLLSYIAGRSAEKELPLLLAAQQYEIGLEAGKELRRLHHFSHPDQQADYAARRIEKYERYGMTARDLGITFQHQTEVHRYIEQHYSDLGKAPCRLQHDDYHVGNLIVLNGQFAGIIDFNRCDWGDPLEDFYKLPWFSAPVSLPFARGQVDGYLSAGIIQDFWPRYNLFVALSLQSSLVWAHRTYPEHTGLFRKRVEEIVNTHDFKEDGPPAWYEQDAQRQ